MTSKVVDLSVRLGPCELPTPVLVAAGCGGRGPELARFQNLGHVGAFVTASVTATRRETARAPATGPAASGWWYSGRGHELAVDTFVRHDLPWLRRAGARVIVSIAGGSANEYAQVAATLRASEAFDAVVAVEVNLARLGGAHHTIVYATDPASAGKLVALVRERMPRDVPVFAKLCADVTDVTTVASVCVRSGVEGLTIGHPFGSVVLDPTTLALRVTPEVPGSGTCGPAIAPLTRRAVWLVHAAMLAGRLRRVPIIACGGVASGTDAVELMAAGASAVQVGSALFSDPGAIGKVTSEISEVLTAKGCATVADVVGRAHER